MNNLTLPIVVGKKYIRRDGKIITAGPPLACYDSRLVCVASQAEADKIGCIGHSRLVRPFSGAVNMDREHPFDLVADYVEAENQFADQIQQYADDWKANAEPWNLWEVKRAGEWVNLTDHPHWQTSCTYRRKPTPKEVVVINGVTVNAPMRTAPPDGTICWYVGSHGTLRLVWKGSTYCKYLLADHNVFHTKEDAEAARLVISITFAPQRDPE